MTTFKFLLTLLSVAVVASAKLSERQSKTPKCDVSGCIKAISAIVPAAAKCATAGADLANSTADPLKKASETLDCVSGLTAASLSVPSGCNNCVQAANSGQGLTNADDDDDDDD